MTDLPLRLAACEAFRDRIKSLGLTIRQFSLLTGYPVKTVYTWTSQGKDCVFPPLPALRFLLLLERSSDALPILSSSAASGG
jgi:hypothetical protein